MRRFLLLVLALGFALTTPPAVQASFVYTTGFESPTFSTGVVSGQDGWFSDIGPAGNITIQTGVVRTGAQAVGFSAAGAMTNTRAGRNTFFETAFTAETLLSVQVAMNLSSGGLPSEWRITGFDGSGHFIGLARVSPTGDLFTLGAADAATGVTVTRDVWHTYELRFDFATRTFDLLFDHEEVASGQSFSPHVPASSAFLALHFEVFLPGTDHAFFDNLSVAAVAMPEPSSLALAGLGLLGLAVGWWRRSRPPSASA